MKIFHKKIVIIVLSSLLLALPITNALHFIVFKHHFDQLGKTKITHKCDDFIFTAVYNYLEDESEIEVPSWNEFIIRYNVFYANNYAFNLVVENKNKGPPLF